MDEKEKKNSVVVMTSNRICMDVMFKTFVPFGRFPDVLFVHGPSVVPGI